MARLMVRSFHVWLESSRLGLQGVLDMMITSMTGEIYPVEFKHSISKKVCTKNTSWLLMPCCWRICSGSLYGMDFFT